MVRGGNVLFASDYHRLEFVFGPRGDISSRERQGFGEGLTGYLPDSQNVDDSGQRGVFKGKGWGFDSGARETGSYECHGFDLTLSSWVWV